MKLYNALKWIKTYILFPYRFPSALLEWSIWFNQFTKPGLVIDRFTASGRCPTCQGREFPTCQVAYQHLAVLPRVQILICNNFTLFLEQSKHNRLFCVDTEKFERVWSRLNTAETRTRVLSLLDITYDSS